MTDRQNTRQGCEAVLARVRAQRSVVVPDAGHVALVGGRQDYLPLP